MMSQIVKVVSNPNVSEVQECDESSQPLSYSLIQDIVARGFDGEYHTQDISIESRSVGSHDKTVTEGAGSCRVLDGGGEQRESFEYEINVGSSSSGRVYDEVEIVINI